MSLDSADPRFERACTRLAPYARGLLERAGEHALEIHADVVTLEHLLSAMMRDEDSGAHALVLHAFADPETIDGEALALSPGLMVVASDATLPFSPGAVEVLVRARVLSQAGEVTPRLILIAALAALPHDALVALRKAGLVLEPSPPASGPSAPLYGPRGLGDAAEPLFRRFTSEAKRALSSANRAAAKADERSIGPARLAIACLELDEALARSAGLAWQRARLALSGHTRDPAPLPPRALPADDALLELLTRLPEAATSTSLLGEMIASGPTELAQILTRHKVTASLVERAGATFGDP